MDDVVFKGRTVRGYGEKHGTPFLGVIRGVDYFQADSIGLIVQILSEPKNTNIPRWLDILFPDEGISFRVFCAVALFEEFDYPSIMIYGGPAYRKRVLTKSVRSFGIHVRGDSFGKFWMESAIDGKVKGFFLHNCVYPFTCLKNLIFEDLLYYEGVPLTVNTNFASSRILVSPKMLVNFVFDSFSNNHRNVMKWKEDHKWGPRKLNAITNVVMAYNHLPEEVKLKGRSVLQKLGI